MALAQTHIEDAKQGIDLIYSELSSLRAEVKTVTEKLERRDKRIAELEASGKGLEQFRPLIREESGETLMMHVRDKTTLMLLRGFSVQVHNKLDKLGDPSLTKDKGLKRRARLNLDYVMTACLKFALEPGNRHKVRAKYLSKANEVL